MAMVRKDVKEERRGFAACGGREWEWEEESWGGGGEADIWVVMVGFWWFGGVCMDVSWNYWCHVIN